MSFFFPMTEDSRPAGGDVVEGRGENVNQASRKSSRLSPEDGETGICDVFPDRNMRLCYQTVNSK